MAVILIELTPLNPATGTRVTLRVTSHDDKGATALNSVVWRPAIWKQPSFSVDLFDGNFSGALDVGTFSFELAMNGLKKANASAATFLWPNASVKVYAGEIGDAWPWTQIAQGIVDDFQNADEILRITAKVDAAPFDVPALTSTYAGTTGAEGPADLKAKVKPWVLGTCSNIEPVLIDAVNSVYQFSAYGPVNAVTACYERGASFGSSVGDYANYTALVAASIPAGRWGTCKASGMVRLGAPAAGIITLDVQGDKPSTFLTKTGEIINRICTNAGVSSGNIDSASLSALDSAVPYGIGIYLTEQTKLIDLVRRLAKPCNAVAGVSWMGKLIVPRVVIGTPALTLDAQGRRLPPVLGAREDAVSPPYWRIEMGADRCWRVHSPSEIAFTASIIEVGDYSGSVTYREGNIVTDQGARWLYINPVASSGNAPPTLPTTSNSYWSNITAPVDYADIDGTKPPANADNTASQTIVSRLSSTTGQALSTFVLANGLNPSSVVASGYNRDGDSITFASTLSAVPKIIFLPGGNAATAGQNVAIQPVGLTTSGFTLKAKSQSVTPGSLVTDGSASSGSGGEPNKVINRSSSSHPYDNQFKFNFTVTVGDITSGEPGQVEVAIYAKIGGSWTNIGGQSYSLSGTYDLSAYVSSIDYGAGNEFGISVVYAEGSGSALSSFNNVKYTPGTVTETSLTPTGASDIPWIATL